MGTIQDQDVSQEEHGAEEGLSSAEAKRESLAEKRFQELNEDVGHKDGEEQNEEIVQEEEKEIDEKPAKYIELTDGNGRTFKIPADAKYRGKVDGQEFVESFENLTRNYQKDKALGQRLHEAAKRIEGLEVRERRAAEIDAALQERAARIEAQEKGAQENASATLRERAARVYRAMMEEDENTAINTLAEQLFNKGDDVDVRQIVKHVDGVVKQRLQEHDTARTVASIRAERTKADQRFGEEYQDIIDDPDLLAIVRTRAASAMQANPNQDGYELLKSIGDDLRQKFGMQQGQPIAGRRKPPPGIPSGNRQSMRQPETEMTLEGMRKAAIDEIRKARGQVL